MSKRSDASVEDSAIAFVQSRHGVDSDAVHVRSSFQGESASHVYFKQAVNGVPVANAVANVAFNKDNKVAAFGSSFVKAYKVAAATPSVTVEDAIAVAEKQLNGTFKAEEFPEPQLEYFAKDDGSLVLTHSFQVANDETGSWYEAFVDVQRPELDDVVEAIAKAG